MVKNGRFFTAATVGLALVLSACSPANEPPGSSKHPHRCGTADGKGCAPQSALVDTKQPGFSRSTEVTNPLFPISKLESALLLGNVDGHPLRVEVTLLPGTKTIDADGKKVKTLVSQYVAHMDGRIHELALDWYAQADDGSVWYFGEDVRNYEDGVIANREGTWLAGKDGPPAMIMPANPKLGDVYRPENIPGAVYEEVTVTAVDQRVNGPSGPVSGAIVVRELHLDGAMENKTFAPGYGEFITGAGSDLEQLAIAVPTDALSSPVPAALETLLTSSLEVFEKAGAGRWDEATSDLGRMQSAWASFQARGPVPELLQAQMTNALNTLSGDSLKPALRQRAVSGSQKGALDVAEAALDLQLRHRKPSEIDRARFGLWVRQIIADSAGDEPGTVAGDVTTLELVWPRFSSTADASQAKQITGDLKALRTAADDEDMADAAERAKAMLQRLP